MPTQTTPLLENPTIVEQHNPPVDQTTIETIGQAAVDGTIAKEYIDDGVDNLEALANGEQTKPDTRIVDVDEAHEAAKHERDIRDIYETAHEENKIRDEISAVYDTAVKENKALDAKIEEEKAEAQPEQTPQDVKGAAAAPDEAKTAESHALPAANSEEVITEAQAALKRAGVSAEIPTGSTVSKSLDGRLYVINDAGAQVITQRFGDGKPVVETYTYAKGGDEGDGVLTVTSGNNKSLTGHIVTQYQSTDLKQWLTTDKVITLPDTLIKHFGIKENAVVVKSA